MRFSEVSDVITMIEYFQRRLHTTMHDNPVLMYWSIFMYPVYYEIVKLLNVNGIRMFDLVSPVFYQRDGKVHVDEFSYYSYAIGERYKVCK